MKLHEKLKYLRTESGLTQCQLAKKLGIGQTTVAGEIRRALETFLRREIELTCAGRTDAGVHARRYVANFFTSSSIPVDRLPYALNTRLPEDIVVTGGSVEEYILGRYINRDYDYGDSDIEGQCTLTFKDGCGAEEKGGEEDQIEGLPLIDNKPCRLGHRVFRLLFLLHS